MTCPKFSNSARAPLMNLQEHGRLNVNNLMFLFQCSRQTIYARIADGRLPKPDGVDGRRPYWLTQTIRPFFERGPSNTGVDSAGAACCSST